MKRLIALLLLSTPVYAADTLPLRHQALSAKYKYCFYGDVGSACAVTTKNGVCPASVLKEKCGGQSKK